jgi:hypothetical protein
MKKKLVLLFASAFLLFFGCCGDSGINPNDNPTIISEEAQLAALWLTNDFYPPLDIASNIDNDLELIRAKFADSLDIFEQEFIFPAVPRSLTIGLSDSAVEAYRAGTYDAWNSQNDDFGLVAIDTFFHGNNFNYAKLHFKDILNPYKLSSYYSGTEGVRYAQPIYLYGDFSNFYPWYVDGDISYLFRYGWGDCPAGCIYSHFWYLKKINGEFEIVGDFITTYPESYPEWWSEISEAFRNYWYQLSAE